MTAPANDIAMAIDIFAHGVNRHVGTQLERVLEIGAGKSIIHGRQALVFFCRGSKFFNIGYLEQRVRRGLQPEQGRPMLFYQLLNLFCVRSVHKDKLMHLFKDRGKNAVSSPIDVIPTDHD